MQKTITIESNGHVTDDVMWPWKVKLVTPVSWRCYLTIIANYYIVCCEAVQSAILAAPWLLFSDVKTLWKFKGYHPQRGNFIQHCCCRRRYCRGIVGLRGHVLVSLYRHSSVARLTLLFSDSYNFYTIAAVNPPVEILETL